MLLPIALVKHLAEMSLPNSQTHKQLPLAVNILPGEQLYWHQPLAVSRLFGNGIFCKICFGAQYGFCDRCSLKHQRYFMVFQMTISLLISFSSLSKAVVSPLHGAK